MSPMLSPAALSVVNPTSAARGTRGERSWDRLLPRAAWNAPGIPIRPCRRPLREHGWIGAAHSYDSGVPSRLGGGDTRTPAIAPGREPVKNVDRDVGGVFAEDGEVAGAPLEDGVAEVV